ncbi:hypothetical protein BU24DRAFT_58171 [Aaosphaeria arxii CBS 175.79]|uniref:Uncharacterized protein n=1 Tax=Aaosphaeria arxii CBS 175.79 TaxID=1450172 RepID=A0A6A5XBZ6_9PLEO|nr:uncharacterized protein BU24DRAFT_58171 [Aaosphaeria arxii CBS 175.79]KAF2010421.1 hypothetical protein BU24DRAFT_58171 [Aaosphaeria arxii CBS 175.79]
MHSRYRRFFWAIMVLSLVSHLFSCNLLPLSHSPLHHRVIRSYPRLLRPPSSQICTRSYPTCLAYMPIAIHRRISLNGHSWSGWTHEEEVGLGALNWLWKGLPRLAFSTLIELPVRIQSAVFNFITYMRKDYAPEVLHW